MSGIPKERMAKAMKQLETISQEDYEKVKGLAAVCKPLRSVILKFRRLRDDEVGRSCHSI